MSTVTPETTEPGTRRSPEPDGRPSGRRRTGRDRPAIFGRLRLFGRARRPRKREQPPRRVRQAPRRWPWVLALALAGVLLIGAVYAVFFSPLLGVKAVAISGADDALAAKIRAVVTVSDGIPLARVDLDTVAAEVETVPEVSSVEVSRGWPDTVSIEVEPRVPVAVTSANGQFYLLDATGDPYLALAAPPAGLVTVQLVAPGVGDPSTIAALTVAAALTPEFRPQVAEISARTAFHVELKLTDGRKVIWGEATRSAQKMQVLPALLAQQPGTEYNVTDPTLVSVR